jgi:hypothetical protein
VDRPDEVDGGDEELFTEGAERPSRWAALAESGQLPGWLLLARRAVITLAALIVVVVAVRAVSSQPRHATKAALAPPSAAGPSRAVQIGPLDDVRALAETPGKLTDYVRVDTPADVCPLVQPGSSPVDAVLRAERTQLGAVQLLDSGRTIDQATGLCELTVRSRLRADVVVTVSITPRARSRHSVAFDRLQTGTATLDGLTVEYGQMISRRGWEVVAGATGPRQRDLPGSQRLLALAQVQDMLW